MPTGVVKEIDLVRDVNLTVKSPLKLSAENSDGMRELHGSNVIFASTANDTVANTTAKTAFAPSGVGSAIVAANSLVVGQVIEITCRGVVSTA